MPKCSEIHYPLPLPSVTSFMNFPKTALFILPEEPMSSSFLMAIQWRLSLWKYQLLKLMRKLKLGRRFNLKTFLLLVLLKLAFVAIYFLYKWNFICSNIPIHNLLGKYFAWRIYFLLAVSPYLPPEKYFVAEFLELKNFDAVLPFNFLLHV